MAPVASEYREFRCRGLPRATVWAGVVAAAVAGCSRPPKKPADTTALEEQIAVLKGRLAAAATQIDRLEAAKRARDAEQGRADKLADAAKAEFVVRGIRLGGFTGGKNWDGNAGDDGLRVYLHPIDRDSHTLKRVGAITLELFDLALKDRHPRIAVWHFKPEEAARHWKSNALYYGYYFQLPWQSIVPAHADLELGAELIALDGTKHTARRSFTIELPPQPD